MILPVNYQPEARDILCGRGNVFSKHEGNKNFVKLIRESIGAYQEAPGRSGKIQVVDNVLKKIQSYGGRFAKIDTKSNRWYQLDQLQAHEKIGHAIRDTIRLITKKNKQKAVAAIRQKQQQEPDPIEAFRDIQEFCLEEQPVFRRSSMRASFLVLKNEFPDYTLDFTAIDFFQV